MSSLLSIRRLAGGVAGIALSLAPAAGAQLSLTTAVDLALHSNPRVQGAESEVARAQAALAETHDVYIPAVNAGAGLGQGYGYLPNPPTLFTVTAGSLVYSASQSFYVRSARAGLSAAQLTLQDVRETVAQDTALAFIALDHDRQRQQAIDQEATFANTLVTIVQDRVNAGQDSSIDLTQAKLTAAQFRLSTLRAQDETANETEHLARLIGIPTASLQIDNKFPVAPVPTEAPQISPQGYASPAVASAFANATARLEQAKGDARFRFRPQVTLFAQYNRYATFTNSFNTLQQFSQNGGGAKIGSDETAFGVQITLPFFDKLRAAKARETAADASKALHDAQNAQIDVLDGLSRTRHSIAELQVQSEVAGLEQQLAQQQLDVLHLQLQNGTGNPTGPQMTPKDEQNARISEREKYLGVVDANFQLHQAEIQLLRQSGGLEAWLKPAASATGSAQQNNLPPTPTPQP
jgi:outer membrane protein TolC